jgi:hypothetical protein
VIRESGLGAAFFWLLGFLDLDLALRFKGGASELGNLVLGFWVVVVVGIVDWGTCKRRK